MFGNSSSGRNPLDLDALLEQSDPAIEDADLQAENDIDQDLDSDPGADTDRVTADALLMALAWIDSTTGQLRRAALDGLKLMIALLDENERNQIGTKLLTQDIFKSKKEVDTYLASCPPPPGAPRFAPMQLNDLLAMPPKEWLIDQIVGKQDLIMVYGPPGSGKTLVIIDATLSACLGRTFAGEFEVSAPLNVAYCAGEGVSGLPARFAAAAEQYGVTTLPNFTFFKMVPQLYSNGTPAGHHASIAVFINEWKARQDRREVDPLDILIIDTFHSATAGADENSAKDMGQALEYAKLAIQELGCAVILVHHTNKAGTGERGSSALRGAMDTMIEVKTLGSKFVMNCEKLKDAEKWESRTFSLSQKKDSVVVWWHESASGESSDGRTSDTADQVLTVLQDECEPMPAKMIAEALGLTDPAAHKALARLEKRGLVSREKATRHGREIWLYSAIASIDDSAAAHGL
jgi:DNA-binding transcriptional ArsR family regulator